MNFDIYSYLCHSSHAINKNFVYLARIDKDLYRRIKVIGGCVLALNLAQLLMVKVSMSHESQIDLLAKKVKELEEDNRDLNMAIYGAKINDVDEDKDEEM